MRLSPTRGYHPEVPITGFPLVLYGGGHVGQALARALEPLPFELTWLDERDSTPADQARWWSRQAAPRAPCTTS